MHDLNSSKEDTYGAQRIEQIRASLIRTAKTLEQETIAFVRGYGLECGNAQEAGRELTRLLIYSHGDSGPDREILIKAMRDRNTLYELTNTISKINEQEIQSSSLTEEI